MRQFHKIILLGIILFPFFGFAPTNLKIDNRRIVYGEKTNYKASWGFFTIGSASTCIDQNLHNVGSAVCFKIDVAGQTNGLARLFYLHDNWTSYIDTASITTHESSRSIREGSYEMDERIHFDHRHKKAEVMVYNKKTKMFVLKKIYDTPENIRDVIAGFMVFRLVDLTKYHKGDTFTINGFYEDEGYHIQVHFLGEEIIRTEYGKILCYRVKPMVPKNHVFSGRDAISVCLAADNSSSIIRIKAKMFVGNIVIDLQK